MISCAFSAATLGLRRDLLLAAVDPLMVLALEPPQQARARLWEPRGPRYTVSHGVHCADG